jgi:hypothetical protein
MQNLGLKEDLALKSIVYSMDALIPGLYVWWGPLRLRLGGAIAEKDYPGVLHSNIGMSLVLPGYRIYSTYQGSYDPQWWHSVFESFAGCAAFDEMERFGQDWRRSQNDDRDVE